MIEQLHDMPSNSIGFRASGKLSRDDYRNVLEPVLSAAAASGEIRMLFELTDFDGLQPGAWFDDVKTGLGLGFGHHSAWKRSAIVTDIAWVAKAFELFSWVTPGEVKVYALDHVDEARTRVAA
jgi:hypothetical protein